MKTLTQLLVRETLLSTRGPLEIPVPGIGIDSRKIQKGELFAALPGLRTDGNLYIDQAVRNGAGAVIHSRNLDAYHPGITYVQVENPRGTLSRISSLYYDSPSSDLHCIGVTGTNGKTSSAYCIYTILNMLGHRCGIISGYWCGTPAGLQETASPLSTPEAPELHRMLKGFFEDGCTHAVIELTSHALSDDLLRAEDLILSRCLYTAMGRDHLDFHSTEKEYFNAKLHMSELSRKDSVISCSPENPLFRYLSDRRVRVLLLHGNNPPDIREYVRAEKQGDTRYLLSDGSRSVTVTLPFKEPFLQENLLLSVTLLWDMIDTDHLDLARTAVKVPGRGEILSFSENRTVIVDYAHNPSGFKAVLEAYTPPSGRTILLFGAAGSRDRGKRPRTAEIADMHSDFIILTEEDPFDEDPIQIFRDLLAGITRKVPGKTLFVFPRRRQAIAYALSLTEPGDTLLILGKGHEKLLRSSSGEISWNDIDEVRCIAADMNWV